MQKCTQDAGLDKVQSKKKKKILILKTIELLETGNRVTPPKSAHTSEDNIFRWTFQIVLNILSLKKKNPPFNLNWDCTWTASKSGAELNYDN